LADRGLQHPGITTLWVGTNFKYSFLLFAGLVQITAILALTVSALLMWDRHPDDRDLDCG
jgi:hypothetical protein